FPQQCAGFHVSKIRGQAPVPALCLLAAPHLAVQLMRHQDATPTTEPVADATPKVAPGPDNDPDVAPDPEDCDVLTLVEVPEDRRVKALRLVSVDGMSMRAAAREVGVSDTTVRRWLRDSEAEATKAA
ncbi:helix-turn-helix domain-containing protein, partial [Rhodococcus rhodochrous]|uniref:helix-turn-helix domain-containing protein n=2 Tax=Rhodococcus rhodochrous TaxID=1829 RepID=UPI0024B9D63D